MSTSFTVKLVVWSGLAIVFALLVAQIMLLVVNDGATGPDVYGFRGADAVASITFYVIGALVVFRQRTNPVGWLMVASGVLLGAAGLSEEYAAFRLLARPEEAALGGVVSAWVANWIWVPALGLTLTLAFLYFPSGSLLSSRWRPVMIAAIASMSVATFSLAFLAQELDAYAPLANPYRIDLPTAVSDISLSISMLILGISMLASVVSLVVRFLRSVGDQRLQLKWILSAQALALTALAISAIGGSSMPGLDVLGVLAIYTIPVAIGIAMLRYRLYEIDIVINRTLVYVPLSALLAGIFAAGIGILRSIFGEALPHSSETAVAGTVVLVVAVTTPIRNQIQAFVDKRFKDVASPEKSIDSFTHDLRRVLDVLDIDGIAARLLHETVSALGATSGVLTVLGPDGRGIMHAVGDGEPSALVVEIVNGNSSYGTLRIGARATGRPYSANEKSAVERVAAEVARSLSLNVPRRSLLDN